MCLKQSLQWFVLQDAQGEPGGEGFVCLCEEVVSVKKGRTKDIDILENEDF